jgi:hypothetical protein
VFLLSAWSHTSITSERSGPLRSLESPGAICVVGKAPIHLVEQRLLNRRVFVVDLQLVDLQVAELEATDSNVVGSGCSLAFVVH